MLREETVEPATLGLLKQLVALPKLKQFWLVGGTDDSLAVYRSVIYFADAEETVEPECFDGMTWIKVKHVITKAFDDYYKRKYK